MTGERYLISINRQLGSGGSAVGKALATLFGFKYLDREITTKAAEKLGIAEDHALNLKEKTAWRLLDSFALFAPYYGTYLPPNLQLPTTRHVFEAESEIIRALAEKESAVFEGRCAGEVLKDHKNLIRIFLCAEKSYRIEALMEHFQLSEKAAAEEIEKSDKERSRYFATYTGKEWQDARNYDICLDLSRSGQEKGREVLLYYISSRFPVLADALKKKQEEPAPAIKGGDEPDLQDHI